MSTLQGDHTTREHGGQDGVKMLRAKKKKASRRNLADCENVNPGLDAFINADMLAKEDPQYGCRRKVLNTHFGNDHIGALQQTLHIPFSPSSPPAKLRSCCKCCNIYIPKTCCNLHNPEVTRGMFDAELVVPPVKWLPQHAKAKYEKNVEKSSSLDEALYKWRKQEFAHRFPDCLNDMWIGDWIMLGDEIIDDIIYLAHANKLSTHDKFIQLIDWEDHECYVSDILPIIHNIFPPPLPVESAPVTSNMEALLAGGMTCRSQCNNCKQTGHNGLYLKSFCIATFLMMVLSSNMQATMCRMWQNRSHQ